MIAFTIASGRDVVVGLAAVLVAFGVIHKYLIRPCVAGFQRLEKSIHATEAQLKPNGGSSTRDAIDRIEVKGENHEVRLVVLEAQIVGLITRATSAAVSLPVVTPPTGTPTTGTTTTTTTVATTEPTVPI